MNNRKIKLVFCFFLSLIILSVFGSADIKNLPEMVKKLSPCIVELQFHGTSQESSDIVTGFFIAPGKILTTANIVHAESITYWDFSVSNMKPVKIKRLLKVSYWHDIALFESEISDTPYLELGNDDSLKLGQDIFVIGYPWDLTVTTGIIASLSTYAGFEFSAPVGERSIGSPVLDAEGKVLGIVEDTDNSFDALNSAMNVNDIKEFLSEPDDPKEFSLVSASMKIDSFSAFFNSIKSSLSGFFNFVFRAGEFTFFLVLKALSIVLFFVVLLFLLFYVRKILRVEKARLVTATFFGVFLITFLVSLLLSQFDFQLAQNRLLIFVFSIILGSLVFYLSEKVLARLREKV